MRESPVRAALVAWLERERPACVEGVDFSGYHEAVDMLVWDLIERQAEEKKLRRHCRTKIVFRLSGDEPGTWHLIKGTWAGNEASVRGSLRARYGARLEEIANERFA